MNLPGHVPLAIATRGGTPENVHFGSIAVADRDGRLLAWAGDAQAAVFARSTLKPFQALPFLEAGGPAHFGWGEAQLALMCASHSAEARHLAIVEGMLADAGFTADDLQCGAHPPLIYLATGNPPPAGETWTALHNNCSGKHAAFLACCRLHGWDAADHLAPEHPLQQAIRAALCRVAELDAAALTAGIDGCSAPNYALPLASLAGAYARLADPQRTPLAALFRAMTGQPGLVSGKGRGDLAFMRAGAGDWVAKVGADGVQALGIRSRGLGIAIKIADGHARALTTVAVEVLRQLGLAGAPLPTPLAPFAAPRLRNWRNTVVGELLPAFTLATTA